MFEQVNAQFASYTKQFADVALKANALAVENFERLVGLQVRTFEESVNDTVAFIGEASAVRDFETAKAFWPKGVALAKASAERFAAVGQEAVGQSIKTSEAMGQLVKANFDAVNDGLAKTAKAAKAAGK